MTPAAIAPGSHRPTSPCCWRRIAAGRGAARDALRWSVPYRVDLPCAGDEALDRLVELGAIDADLSHDGGIAALMPDSVTLEQIARTFGVCNVSIAPAAGRDAGSVWVLSPRAVRIGRLRIVPAGTEAEPDALRLVDAAAFGTGLHPTTALCLEALEMVVRIGPPDNVLDVGTGSGVLALGALMMGVPRALGVDIDDAALRVAAENARINGMEHRLRLARGGPEAVTGTWPVVVANVLAAPLMELAPALVRRVGHQGHLLLSGIPSSLEPDVGQAYGRLGMRRVRVTSRAGWVALVLQASW
jgi:ribosomal protein L11 methylase PrmA